MKSCNLTAKFVAFLKSQCPPRMTTNWRRYCSKAKQPVTQYTNEQRSAANLSIPPLVSGNLLAPNFGKHACPDNTVCTTVMRRDGNLIGVYGVVADSRFKSVLTRNRLGIMSMTGQTCNSTVFLQRIESNQNNYQQTYPHRKRSTFFMRYEGLGQSHSCIPVRCFHSSPMNYRKGRKHPKDRSETTEGSEDAADVKGGLEDSSYSGDEDEYTDDLEEYTDDEEYSDDLDEMDLTDDLYEEQVTLVTPEGGHKVIVVQPNVKWGAKKQHLTTGELMLAESVALVETLPHWKVVDTVLMSTKTPGKMLIFGKGNFQNLTEKIKDNKAVTAVFMSVEALTARQQKEMEEAWGVPVFDRYTVVLQIFKDHARTKEAKLQIALAEIPYLRTRISEEVANLDQQRGGTRTRGGGGETFRELRKRVLQQKEMVIKRALARLKKKRDLLRTGRTKKELPVVSVVGYTNSGKTTLIKALTGEEKIQPQDQLFATLDVTTHAGQLPSKMTAIYVDTVGFLSQLPHHLIASFNATLEDVRLSDLIIHIRDVSHLDSANQKHNVLQVLNNLNLPQHLLDNMVEANNKIDLLDGDSQIPEDDDKAVVNISALKGTGLDELRTVVEVKLFEATNTVKTTLRIPMGGPQLSYLYKNATVRGTRVTEDAEHLEVDVIMGKVAFSKFMHAFMREAKQT